MVVLAAAIVTKSGKALVSRQFLDMTRIRIEGLLAAFPKLVGSGKQHTYVDTENVRYLYQPMESMYLVLVTNKMSNILEDLETLRLCGKVVPEYVPAMDEEGVAAAAFDLIFAFDEVISCGHKENVTVGQVIQNTEMESHEEKLHKMIIASKIAETREAMQRKAGEIEKRKLESARGGGGRGAGVAMGAGADAPYPPAMLGGGGGMGGGAGGMGPGPMAAAMATRAADGLRGEAGGAPRAKKGMQLGGRGGAKDLLASLKAEGEAVEDLGRGGGPGGAAASAAATAAASTAPVMTEPVHVSIEERLSAVLIKDGGMQSMEVQGTMALTVGPSDAAGGCLRVALQSPPAGRAAGFQFKTHPNIDKALYSDHNTLGLKAPDRPFPIGAPLGVLKWRFQTDDEAMAPLSINAWPSVSGGQSYVNIEYQSQVPFDLHDVVISIPVPAGSGPPTVNQLDGNWRFDSRASRLVWSIDLVDRSNANGALEFVVPGADPGAFFPIEAAFSADTTLCGIQVASVTAVEDDTPIRYAAQTSLVTDEYVVE